MHWNSISYFDLCLPFGLRSSPFHFASIADAIEWIMKHRFLIPYLIHYLDDYFLAGPANSSLCKHCMDIFIVACNYLGMPLSSNKLVGPTTTLVYLGIAIDSVKKESRLPLDKYCERLELSHNWHAGEKSTKQELQSLIGHLSLE